MCLYIHPFLHVFIVNALDANHALWPTKFHLTPYTRSPLQDSRLFGLSPWKILALIV